MSRLGNHRLTSAPVRDRFQLRRYAWSAGLPISIVTDFEEFALYDGQSEPKPDDDAAVARLMFLGFAELATEWEKLESILSYRKYSEVP